MVRRCGSAFQCAGLLVLGFFRFLQYFCDAYEENARRISFKVVRIIGFPTAQAHVRLQSVMAVFVLAYFRYLAGGFVRLHGAMCGSEAFRGIYTR